MTMELGSAKKDSCSVLLHALKDVRATWPMRGWSWDGRWSCISSSFSVELEPKARAAIAPVLTNEWGPLTLARAPSPIREVAERTGGLRAGQAILASAASADIFAYGLWWPWGDGMTTSLRVGLGGVSASQEALQRLRDAFGVEL
jgi:hypothetical protein